MIDASYDTTSKPQQTCKSSQTRQERARIPKGKRTKKAEHKAAGRTIKRSSKGTRYRRTETNHPNLMTLSSTHIGTYATRQWILAYQKDGGPSMAAQAKQTAPAPERDTGGKIPRAGTAILPLTTHNAAPDRASSQHPSEEGTVAVSSQRQLQKRRTECLQTVHKTFLAAQYDILKLITHHRSHSASIVLSPHVLALAWPPREKHGTARVWRKGQGVQK